MPRRCYGGQSQHARSCRREGHGLVLPDRQAVARYARVIGDDRRTELLIFYHEVGGTAEGILERAERAFEVRMERS